MRAAIILLIGLYVPGHCTAQACYIVDSIHFSPMAPTTEDTINLTLYGDLIGRWTKVISVSITQEDHEIIIHIASSCDNNTAFVLPHREQLSLPALPIGSYHLKVEGSGAALMDTTTHVVVVPYAGRYLSSVPPAEMMRFDAHGDEFILDIDPALYVSRVRVYDVDAKIRREAYIDGFGLTRISTKGLPEGNYLIVVDCDTGNITRWATIRRGQ